MRIGSWMQAFRLRTLPLALSCVIAGSAIAYSHGEFCWIVASLTALTTILLQVLSNLANDYGDAVKGTDNENRLGPERAVQSGEISAQAMKNAVILFAILSLLSGLGLLFTAFEPNLSLVIWLGIGLGAIAAAIKYTMGKTAYGYKGLGDLFVFLFFGLVGVMGTIYMQTQTIVWQDLLPASAIGLLATGVLNLNNMRDHKNDAASGKYTLVTKMGIHNAKTYHAILVIIPFVLLIVYLQWIGQPQTSVYLIPPLVILGIALRRILKNEDEQLLDPELKVMALSTFLTSILFALAVLLPF